MAERVGIGGMLVTTPAGESIRREIEIVYDDRGFYEIKVLGKSPLEGYSFLVKQSDLTNVKDRGTPR